MKNENVHSVKKDLLGISTGVYPHQLGGYCVSPPKKEISKHCDKCKIETKVKSEKVCMYY